jgi:hypothetical protein
MANDAPAAKFPNFGGMIGRRNQWLVKNKPSNRWWAPLLFVVSFPFWVILLAAEGFNKFLDESE